MPGVSQWFVLRRHVAEAAWWIPANSLAWAFGMPCILGQTQLPADSGPARWLATAVITLEVLSRHDEAASKKHVEVHPGHKDSYAAIR